MALQLEDGLLRADGDIDIGAFYDVVDSAEFKAVELENFDVDNLQKFLDNLKDGIEDIINKLTITGKINNLSGMVVNELETLMETKLSVRERGALNALFNVVCSGYNLDLLGILRLLEMITLAVMLYVTICNRQSNFKLLYDQHSLREENNVRATIDNIRSNMGVHINSNSQVTHTSADLDRLNITLNDAVANSDDVELKDAMSEYGIAVKNRDKYLNELDDIDRGVSTEDRNIAYQRYVDNEKEVTQRKNILEAKFTDTIAVGMQDILSDIRLKEKQLDELKANASNNGAYQRLLEDLNRQVDILNGIKNDKRRLFADVTELTTRMLINKADGGSVTALLKSILETDVTNELRQRDTALDLGILLDSTLEGDTPVNTYLYTKKATNPINLQRYKQPVYVHTVKEKRYSLLEEFVNSPVNPPIVSVSAFNYEVLRDYMLEVLNPFDTKRLNSFRQSKVLRGIAYAYQEREGNEDTLHIMI